MNKKTTSQKIPTLKNGRPLSETLLNKYLNRKNIQNLAEKELVFDGRTKIGPKRRSLEKIQERIKQLKNTHFVYFPRIANRAFRIPPRFYRGVISVHIDPIKENQYLRIISQGSRFGHDLNSVPESEILKAPIFRNFSEPAEIKLKNLIAKGYIKKGRPDKNEQDKSKIYSITDSVFTKEKGYLEKITETLQTIKSQKSEKFSEIDLIEMLNLPEIRGYSKDSENKIKLLIEAGLFEKTKSANHYSITKKAFTEKLTNAQYILHEIRNYLKKAPIEITEQDIYENTLPIYMYKEGQLARISKDEFFQQFEKDTVALKKKNPETSNVINLREVHPMYYRILNQLDGDVKAVLISDPHGAQDKMYTALSIFPNADLYYGGDVYDRADNAFLSTMLLQTFGDGNDLSESEKFFHFCEGNHDAMIHGLGLGEVVSMAHGLRFLLRYNESGFLEKDMGLSLKNSLELAKLFNERDGFKGNFKAKDENYLLEAFWTNEQLKLTYGDKKITLTDSEKAFLHNLKFSKNQKNINNSHLEKLFKKIEDGFEHNKEYKKVIKLLKTNPENKELLAQKQLFEEKYKLTKEEINIMLRIKAGNHHVSKEESDVLRNLQKQIIKNKKFRMIVKTGLKTNKMYQIFKIAGKTFLMMHANIPLNKDGSFREVQLAGENKKYSGFELLDKIQEKRNLALKRFEALDEPLKKLDQLHTIMNLFENLEKASSKEDKDTASMLLNNLISETKNQEQLKKAIPQLKELVEQLKYDGYKFVIKTLEKIKEDFEIQNLEEELDTLLDGKITKYLEEVGENKFFDWQAWSPDSPLYSRVMKTFERAYMADISGTYDEPEDEWYNIMQNPKNQSNPEALKVLARMEEKMGLQAGELHIVNGHKRTGHGKMAAFANGRILRIDAGASSEYEGHGLVTLITKNGTIYGLSLSDQKEKKSMFQITKVVNGEVIDIKEKL